MSDYWVSWVKNGRQSLTHILLGVGSAETVCGRRVPDDAEDCGGSDFDLMKCVLCLKGHGSHPRAQGTIAPYVWLGG